MTLIDICLIVLILIASSICVFLIVYLKKIYEQIESICIDIHQLVEYTIPILNNLEEITERTNRIVAEVEVYWGEIDHFIRALLEKFSIFEPWKKILSVQMPIMHIIKNSSSIAKGVSAFWSKYKHR
jgi:predicted PurR-regulated permease PerM